MIASFPFEVIIQAGIPKDSDDTLREWVALLRLLVLVGGGGTSTARHVDGVVVGTWVQYGWWRMQYRW